MNLAENYATDQIVNKLRAFSYTLKWNDFNNNLAYGRKISLIILPTSLKSTTPANEHGTVETRRCPPLSLETYRWAKFGDIPRKTDHFVDG